MYDYIYIYILLLLLHIYVDVVFEIIPFFITRVILWFIVAII